MVALRTERTSNHTNNRKLQTVLLTGGSEGMGRSAARMLAAKGANVVIVARNVGKLEEALAEITVGGLRLSCKATTTIPGTRLTCYI